MKKKFKFRSIKSRLYWAFGLIMILVLALGVFTLNSVQRVNDRTKEIVENDMNLVIADLKIASAMEARLSAVRAYMLFGEAEYKEEFQMLTEYSIDIETKANKIGANFGDLFERTAAWSQAVETDVFDMYDQNREVRAVENLQTLSIEGKELIAEFHTLAADREKQTIAHGDEIIYGGRVTLRWVFAVTILTLLISGVSSVLTSRVITRPLGQVRDRMNTIAAGDLSQDPLVILSEDEAGQLAVAMNEMSENTRAILNRINDVSYSVSAHSEEMTQSSREVNQASAQIALTMQDLTAGIESEANTATDLAMTMDRFVEKVEHANDRGTAIQETSKNVMTQTSTGTELMESSTAQMQRIDAIVSEAVTKIKGLDSQSQEISKLVVVIKDIADQTNLLALNAAIEAARAGEHGKGFAVVAEEVRKLAEQVAVSVTDITGIVGTIQQESSHVADSLESGYEEVEKGTAQLHTTRATFDEISNAVNKMTEDISHISENLSEIAAGSEEMSESVEEIAAISEQSAAGVQQTSAASQETSSSMEEMAASSEQLAELAEEMTNLVSEFKL